MPDAPPVTKAVCPLYAMLTVHYDPGDFTISCRGSCPSQLCRSDIEVSPTRPRSCCTMESKQYPSGSIKCPLYCTASYTLVMEVYQIRYIAVCLWLTIQWSGTGVEIVKVSNSEFCGGKKRRGEGGRRCRCRAQINVEQGKHLGEVSCAFDDSWLGMEERRASGAPRCRCTE